MSHKKTTAEFISQAILVHGNAYDYAQVNYVDSKTKIIITCALHGAFSQEPRFHLMGNGCPICGNKKRGKEASKSLSEFIEDAKNKHGHRYDYLNSIYVNSKTKLAINCIEHGVFYQKPNSHLGGQGCPTCGAIKQKEHIRTSNHANSTKSMAVFIKEAEKAHNNKYGYSNAIYISGSKKVIITCPIHGDFWQTPRNHIHGHGCPQCANKIRRESISKTTLEFVEGCKKIHGDKYSYDNTIYYGNKLKVIISCLIHGEFSISAGHHLNGHGCQRCANCYRRTTTEFINDSRKIHGDKYDYSLAEYTRSNVKAKIICKRHGIFMQTPSHHLMGVGCPSCLQSRGENEIERQLKLANILFVKQKTFDGCLSDSGNKLRFDFFIPAHNICIEFDGQQHFKPINCFGGEAGHKKALNNDKAKDIYCNEAGVKLIRINYTQIDRNSNSRIDIIGLVKNVLE